MKWMGMLLCLLGIQGAMAGSALVDASLGLIFPQEFGGMAYVRADKYNEESFGYSIAYRKGDSFEAVVTIYDLDRPAIPDGHKGDGIDLVFQSVENDLQRKQGKGLVSNLRKRRTTVIPNKGDVRFTNRGFQYHQSRVVEGATNRVQRIQSTYVTAAHANFFRIDFTFDVAEGAAARAMSQHMLLQMIKTIQAKPDGDAMLMAACDALILDPAGFSGRSGAQLVLARAQTMGNLNVYTHLFAWPDSYWQKPKNADLLVAAYFAGMLQVVVPQKLDEGGECEAFVAMLKAYEAMRSRDQIKSIAEFDEWVKAADKKALFDELLFAPVEE
ncbi:MAG: hypothetical protein U9P12_10500 [Verrucomicrobiota bacterium]|nr:hypothetical protein [Verrucomicrobiota bacterium]